MTGELEVGTCRYCGATRFIEADGIIDADVYATYKCVCGDAKKARLRAKGGPCHDTTLHFLARAVL